MMNGSPGYASSWLAYCKPNPQARLRLFCFPYAGGGASTYRTWASELPSVVDVCPVQLPGRETRLREAPLTRIGPLVSAITEAIHPFLDIPFCFFGHSMGAIVSFEMARHLRLEHGLVPRQLFVSGRRAPHLPDPDPPKYNLPEDEFLEEIKRLNGTPEEAFQSKELMQLLLPVMRADCEVIEVYEYAEQPPLSCSISAYGGLSDDEAPREDLEAWCRHTSAAFALAMFPGDHFFLQTSRQALLRALSRELQQLAHSAA